MTTAGWRLSHMPELHRVDDAIRARKDGCEGRNKRSHKTAPDIHLVIRHHLNALLRSPPPETPLPKQRDIVVRLHIAPQKGIRNTDSSNTGYIHCIVSTGCP